MSLINYTSYDDIRAALGVSDEELEDDTLGLTLYEDHLKAELDDISYGLDPFHATLEAVPETDLDPAQKRFMMAARLFATYATARTLTVTLPVFAPKTIEDGKARMERHADPYKATIQAINSEYERWRNRLKDAFLALGETSAVNTRRTYLSVVSPASDPITGT